MIYPVVFILTYFVGDGPEVYKTYRGEFTSVEACVAVALPLNNQRYFTYEGERRRVEASCTATIEVSGPDT
jgi:hypothetical protein